MLTYLFIAVCCLAVWSTIALFIMRADRNNWRELSHETAYLANKDVDKLIAENQRLQEHIKADRKTIAAYEQMLNAGETEQMGITNNPR